MTLIWWNHKIDDTNLVIKGKTMSKPDGQIKINATPELKLWFKGRAAANKRSLNNEILFHLERIREMEGIEQYDAKTTKPQRVQDARASFEQTTIVGDYQ